MIKNSVRPLLFALVSVIFLSTFQTPLSAESGIYDRIGIFPEHGNQGVGEESINYFNGNLTLKFLDVHLPGPNGFDLNIWRIYNSKLAEDSTGWNLAQFNQEPVGWVGLGWSLHMGRVHLNAITQEQTIEFPDGRCEIAYLSKDGTCYVTKNLLKFVYENNIYKLYFPDGTVWLFEKYATIFYDNYKTGIAYLVTQIINSYGHKIIVEYHENRPTIKKITDSLNRVVTFVVDNENNEYPKLKEIQVKDAHGNTSVYTYTVDTYNNYYMYRLSKFKPPLLPESTYLYNNSDYEYELKEIKTSYGGTVQYKYDYKTFYFYEQPLQTRVVTEKHVQFSEGESFNSWYFSYPAYQDYNDRTVTITGPEYTSRITYYAHTPDSPGTLMEKGWTTGLIQKKWFNDDSYSEEYEWIPEEITNLDWMVLGYNVGKIKAPLISKIIKTSKGDAESTEEHLYERTDTKKYGLPTKIKYYGGINGTTLENYKTLEYFYETNSTFRSKYMLNYIKYETTYTSGLTRLKEVETNYYTGTGNCGAIDYIRQWRTGNEYLTWDYGYSSSNPNDITITIDLPGSSGTETYYYQYGTLANIIRPGYTELTRNISGYNSAILSETNQHNGTMNFTYDNLNRITFVDMPTGFNDINVSWNTNSVSISQGGNTVNKYWDGMGRDTGYTESGDSTTLYYLKNLDAESRVDSENKGSTSASHTFTYQRNYAGSPTIITDPRGKITDISYYDDYKTVTDAENNQTTFYYHDLPGLVTNLKDAFNNNAYYTYDWIGRLLETDYYGSRTQSYQYNGLDQVRYEEHPETGLISYTYNTENNLWTKTWGGITHTYTYNTSNQLKQIDANDEIIDYAYDTKGRVQNISSNKGWGRDQMTYNTLGSLLTERQTIPGLAAKNISYDYDGNNNLKFINYPDGRSVNTTNNGLQMPETLSFNSKMLISQIAYGNAKQPVSMTIVGNNTTFSASYYENGALNSISLKKGTTTHFNGVYGYDNVGNITSISSTIPSLNVNCTYDDLYRLTYASYYGGKYYEYTHDAWGNLQTARQNGTYVFNQSYNTQNQFSSSYYDYDNRGNLTTAPGFQYVWDNQNRLITNKLDTGEIIANHVYNEQGLRVKSSKVPSPSISILTPAPGQIWNKNGTYSITWTITGLMDEYVKISLRQGETQVLEIINSTTNDGSHDWTIPITVQNGEYSILVQTVDNQISGLSGLFLISGTNTINSFTEITGGEIIADITDSTGAAWADYNNDDDLDLFVANFNQNNFLFKNNGSGYFTKILSGSIVTDVNNSQYGSWGDYDNDGDLDLFVPNYDQNSCLYMNNGNQTFTKVSAGVSGPGKSFGSAWGDYDNDGWLDLFVANYNQKNFLYKNNKNGTFTKITSGSIVNDIENSTSGTWCDYDNDNDLDLFVTNYDQHNSLYKNNGDGTFTKITSGEIVNDVGKSYGSAWGDFDNDGDFDLFVNNRENQNNFFYKNNGNGTFTKITGIDLVIDGGNSYKANWGDFDNDGDLDLFVLNAFADNFLYQNNGDATFTKITAAAIVPNLDDSRGKSWGDYDNDGDLDLFIAKYDKNNALFRNDGNSNKWIMIKCVGNSSNRAGIGAKVKVKAAINGYTIWQTKEITERFGLHAAFGLGNAAIIAEIQVEWPSGIIQTLNNVSINQYLTITEPEQKSITVTSPNGGETLEVGAASEIKWSSTGAITGVDIEYSTDNGTSWTDIITSTANDNTYEWTVPDTPSNNCLIKIIESGGTVSDTSDAVFVIATVVVPTITITSPNGGEAWEIESIHNITWTSAGGVGNVRIEYSLTNGVSWYEIIASTENDGIYYWTLPGIPSDNCLVRISEIDGDPMDTSDNVFSITEPQPATITVISPNGGEIWEAGSIHNITWTSSGSVGMVKIEYSTNNGTSWIIIVSSTTNDGTYSWTVPDIVSNSCLIRISEIDGDPLDISNSVFSIAAPQPLSITVTSPNGGEIWEIGSIHNITWTSTGNVGNIKIEYTTDNGASWTTIVSSTINNGSYNWTVPNTPSNSCLVRISEIDNNPVDYSNSVFSIIVYQPPSITVTSPNGGETWVSGNYYYIKWNSTGAIGKVKIEYSTNNGSNYITIVESTGNYGSYSWTVPFTNSDHCLIRISEIDGDQSDTSNSVFSIIEVEEPNITVTKPNGGESINSNEYYSILWNSTDNVGPVKIEYSTNSGDSWKGIVTSTENDGYYNWNIQEDPSNNCLIRISENDGTPVDVSDSTFAILPDPDATCGDTWNYYYTYNGTPADITYGMSRFILVGSNGSIMTSNYGSTWYEETSGTTADLKGICYGGSQFIAVGEAGTIITSPNGFDWTIRDPGTDTNFNSITYGESIYVAVGDGGKVYTSTDGISWTSRYSNVVQNLQDVTYGDSRFVAVGDGGTIISGPNGIYWTKRTSPITQNIQSVTRGESLFVAVSLNGNIISSPDGISWTKRTSGTSNHLYSIAYAKYTKYVAVGEDSCILTSSNGINWESKQSGIPETLFAIAFGYYYTRFVAVGNDVTCISTCDSSQSTPQIDILSPKGGEIWGVGSTQIISWRIFGDAGNLKIELSTANEESYSTISSSTENDGTYFWTVPNKTSNYYRIRISETDGISYSKSHSFSIVNSPNIKVTSPNGGESLQAGSSHNITWTSTGNIDSVKIDISDDNGYSWKQIDNFENNDVLYNWIVPYYVSNNCLIRVCENVYGPSDISDSVFSIFATTFPTIIVTSPNGGEKLVLSTEHNITWESTGIVGNVKIEYSTNNGTSWTTIAASTANDGSFTWMLPGSPLDNCLLRVSETDGYPWDTSDKVFSIVIPPAITITSPNGREHWTMGSSKVISWTSEGNIDNVKIEYSMNNGSTWTGISDAAENDGTFAWTVPGTPSMNCLVRVSEINGTASDSSDNVFSILSPSPITITSPNGGEAWEAGSNHDITWTCTGTFEKVKIEYSTTSGTSWQKIADSTANDGTYNWTIPDAPSDKCLVQISIIDANTDEYPPDISDALFSIVTNATSCGKTWKNSNYSGSDVFTSVTYGSSLFAAVGQDGVIMTGIDGISWTSQTSGTTNHLNGIAYGNNTFTAVGDNGLILTSPNGITWTTQTSGTSNGLKGILHEANQFIAVGVNGVILTSPNSINWTSRSPGTSDTLYDITYNSNTGTFAVVGANGTILTSPDAINWTTQSAGITKTLYSIAWGDNRFVAVGESGIILTGTDGIDWNSRTSSVSTDLSSVIYDHSTFVIVGKYGEILTGYDGINWTSRDSLVNSDLNGIAYGNSSFVTVGTGIILYSLCPPETPGITLTSPNGGESWSVGSTHNITWTHTGNVGNVIIDYSNDNGNSWTGIISSTINDGSHPWNIPDTPSDLCLVRIGETDGDPADASDAVFSIITGPEPTITVTSPNGGETLFANTSHEITWDSTGNVMDVNIEYSIDNGGTWISIAASVTNTGSYDWTVPHTPSALCLVRISADVKDLQPTDTSDAVFEIVTEEESSITVTSPNGRETLTVGTVHEITWTTMGTVGEVKIEYSTDNGSTWTAIATSTPNDGSFSWTVPDTPANDCLVRISENDEDGMPSDMSDAVFSIVTSTSTGIMVTSPNGGETWEIGSIHEITWTSTGNVGDVNIKYSIDNGIDWIGISQSTTNDGSHAWTIPNTPSENSLIRVSDIDGDIFDTGNAVFSIVLPSKITITAPNGGETLEAGSNYSIVWQSTGTVKDVNIEYSTDSGTTWKTIVKTLSNQGTYNWLVPDEPSNNCLVRIKESNNDTGPADVSDAVFSIVTPSTPVINITFPNGGEALTVGTSYHITWATAGTIENVKIQYSVDGGTTWIEIVNSTTNEDSYQWTVPDNPSVTCLVRVSDIDDEPYDTSDDEFSIIPPSVDHIAITSPNGGETLNSGTSYDITWTSTGAIDSVNIEYSTDNSTTWRALVTSTANDGTYTWTVPDTPSDNCLVKVCANDEDKEPSDISDAVFSIESEPGTSITVISPNGSEGWEISTMQTITWTGTGTIENVTIEYSINSGTTWKEIIASTPNTGSYEWTIPDTPSVYCLVRVSEADTDTGPSDTSDSYFSIISETFDCGEKWTGSYSGNNTFNAIVYGNSRFVTVGAAGIIMTGSGKTAWTTQSSGTTADLHGITWGNNIFITVGSQGTILTSPDGTNWTTQSTVTDKNLDQVAYGNNQFIAVGNQGTILTSPNGTTWETQSPGITEDLYGIAYGSGKFTTVGTNGIVLTSTNGIDWTKTNPGINQTLYDIVYGNNQFLAVGDNGIIITSANGINWNLRAAGVNTPLLGAAYGNSIFAIVGQKGKILTGTAETGWEARESYVREDLKGTAFGNSLFTAAGTGNILYSLCDTASSTAKISNNLPGILELLPKITNSSIDKNKSIDRYTPLRLISLNGAEVLHPDEKVLITWESSESIENVKLEYSPDNGTTYLKIADRIPNTGNYEKSPQITQIDTDFKKKLNNQGNLRNLRTSINSFSPGEDRMMRYNYEWQVPHHISANCLLRISEVKEKKTPPQGLLYELNFKVTGNEHLTNTGEIFSIYPGDAANQAINHTLPRVFFSIETNGKTYIHWNEAEKEIGRVTGFLDRRHNIRIIMDNAFDQVSVILDGTMVFESIPRAPLSVFSPAISFAVGPGNSTNIEIDDVSVSVFYSQEESITGNSSSYSRPYALGPRPLLKSSTLFKEDFESFEPGDLPGNSGWNTSLLSTRDTQKSIDSKAVYIHHDYLKTTKTMKIQSNEGNRVIAVKYFDLSVDLPFDTIDKPFEIRYNNGMTGETAVQEPVDIYPGFGGHGTSENYSYSAPAAAFHNINSTPDRVQNPTLVDIYYIYTYDGKLLAEYDQNGNCVKDYIYAGNRLIAEYYPPPVDKYYYYMPDQVNSVRIVTDENGDVVYSAAYGPYGEIEKVWNDTYKPRLKFSGKEREEYTELDYFGARYYDHKHYRFNSVDPVINKEEALYNSQLWNLYSYCRNNPITFYDPYGRQSENEFGWYWIQHKIIQEGGEDGISTVQAMNHLVGMGTMGMTAGLVGYFAGAEIIAATGFAFNTFGNRIINSLKRMANWSKTQGINLGQNFEKLGTVVENPNIKITGLTPHAINQIINRLINPKTIIDTLQNPVVVFEQLSGNFLYLSEKAAVVIKNSGIIVTAYNKFDSVIQNIIKLAGVK